MAECVTGCSRPTQDVLCRSCAGRLVADLRELVDGGRDATGVRRPGLLAELDATYARRAVLDGERIGVRSPSAERALPYDPHAAELRWVAENTLGTWCRDVAETAHRQVPRGDAGTAAAWLASVPGLLAMHPAADELYDEITHVVACIRRAVDRPADRRYLGPCECGADLYAPSSADRLTCRDCGTPWRVADRRAYLLSHVEDRAGTATEISRALPDLLACRVTASMVRGYARRGRLVAHSYDEHAHPRYRIGDVIDIVTRERHIAR